MSSQYGKKPPSADAWAAFFEHGFEAWDTWTLLGPIDGLFFSIVWTLPTLCALGIIFLFCVTLRMQLLLALPICYFWHVILFFGGFYPWVIDGPIPAIMWNILGPKDFLLYQKFIEWTVFWPKVDFPL